MNTNMIFAPLSQETVALALSRQIDPTESLDMIISRALFINNNEFNHKMKNKRGSYFCELFGKRQYFPNPTELFVSVLITLGEPDEHFYDRLYKQMGYEGPRKRRKIARYREDLYPQDASDSVKKEARALPHGWWVGTSYSTPDKMHFLQKACNAARIAFGKDEIDPRLLVNVTLPLSDDEL